MVSVILVEITVPFFAMYSDIRWLLPVHVSSVATALITCLDVVPVCVILPSVAAVQPVDTSPTTNVPATFTGVAVDAIVVAVALPSIETAAKDVASVEAISIVSPTVVHEIPVPPTSETNIGLADDISCINGSPVAFTVKLCAMVIPFSADTLAKMPEPFSRLRM